MSDERKPPRTPRRLRKTSGDRLRAALLDLADHRAQVLEHKEVPWASITFAGARHTLTLLFVGEEAATAGEHFIAALPDHVFAIPGQLVADASISECEHRMLPHPRIVVTCEVLMLEEG